MGTDTIFERTLKTYIYKLFPSGKLRSAALYALFPGGKRLRPKLVYLFGEALGVPKKKLGILASSLEMIHNYTLIHDDLPAMDDDDLRRGKATLHRKFDEATAILVGDALLTEAFELLATLESPKLFQFVANCVGAKGVIHGQMLDLGTDSAAGTDTDSPGTDTTAEGGVSVPNFRESVSVPNSWMSVPGPSPAASVPQFLKIYHLKTAKLFEAAIVGPSHLSKNPLQTKKKLSNFANLFGLCFQIADDLRDAQEIHRKKIPTLAKYLGNEKAGFLFHKKLDALYESLDHLPLSEESREAIKNFLKTIPNF